MKQRTICKTLAVAVIILFLGLAVQPSVAVQTKTEMYIKESQKTFKKLPDLICERINVYPHDAGQPDQYIDAWIRNIGRAEAQGNLTINFKVERTLFGLFGIRTVFEEYSVHNLKILPPGELQIRLLASCPQIPAILGIYKFKVELNPDRTIEERFYINNCKTRRLLHINGFYIP